MRFLLSLLIVLLVAGNVFAAGLKVYSGAGLIKPMEEMRLNFEKKYNTTIQVHYGSSGEIFGMLAMGQPCDVLIPGAAKYTMDALKNGWIVESSIVKLVKHVPVIAVPKGNPANIASLEDLTKPGISLAMGDPKGPAIGKVAMKIFQKNKIQEKVQPNIKVLAPTVNQLLIYVALNQVNGSVIWEDLVSWAEGKGKLDVIQIDPKKNIIKTIPTAVTTYAKGNSMAFKFNEYISSAEGLSIWEKWGFERCAK